MDIGILYIFTFKCKFTKKSLNRGMCEMCKPVTNNNKSFLTKGTHAVAKTKQAKGIQHRMSQNGTIANLQ